MQLIRAALAPSPYYAAYERPTVHRNCTLRPVASVLHRGSHDMCYGDDGNEDDEIALFDNHSTCIVDVQSNCHYL